MNERRSGMAEFEGRLVRLEVTSENVRDDVGEIKSDIRSLAEQMSGIATSHSTFQSEIKGRIWGLRAAWAAILGLGALIWKLLQGQHA